MSSFFFFLRNLVEIIQIISPLLRNVSIRSHFNGTEQIVFNTYLSMQIYAINFFFSFPDVLFVFSLITVCIVITSCR